MVKTKMVPERWLKRIEATGYGSYFIFYRNYAKVMPKLTALFYQDLLNLSKLKKIKKKKKDGKRWILVTVKFLENSKLGWSEKEQRAHFSKLESLGFLKRDRKGTVHGGRWIYINRHAVYRALDKVLQISGDKIHIRPPGRMCIRPPGRTKKEQSFNTKVLKEKEGRQRYADGRPYGVSQSLNGKHVEESPSAQRQRAARLHKVITEILQIQAPRYLSKWTNDFARGERKYGQDNVELVLSWYEKNAHRTKSGDRQVPTIVSAEGFFNEKKFTWLLDKARQEKNLQNGKAPLPDLEPTETGQYLVEKLLEYRWPKGSAEQLPKVIEHSLKNFQEFRAGCARLSEQKDHPLQHYAEYIVASHTAFGFVQRWWVKINHMLHDWADWSGKLDSFVVSVRHKNFRSSVLTDSSYPLELWTRLMEELGYAN